MYQLCQQIDVDLDILSVIIFILVAEKHKCRRIITMMNVEMKSSFLKANITFIRKVFTRSTFNVLASLFAQEV